MMRHFLQVRLSIWLLKEYKPGADGLIGQEVSGFM
jgi:hypothetical protein